MASPPTRNRLAFLKVARRHLWRPTYGPQERLALVTSDGVALGGAYLEGPKGAVATVVLVHGFTHSSRTPRIYAFARRLSASMSVVVPDLRGHGDSAGTCTLGDREPFDVAAAVDWARSARPDLPVVTIGISLGGAAALLHAGGHGGVAGVVAISSPAWWGAWDTPATNRVRRYATTRIGRVVASRLLRTRIADHCAGVPDSSGLAALIAPAFTLIVADPGDHYFAEEHPQTLFRWAKEPKELWMLPGTGHGTDLLTPDFTDRLAAAIAARLSPASSAPR